MTTEQGDVFKTKDSTVTMNDDTPIVPLQKSTLTPAEIDAWGQALHDLYELDDNTEMRALARTFDATFLIGDGAEVNLIDQDGHLHHQTSLRYRGVYRRWRFCHAFAHVLLHYSPQAGAGIFHCRGDLCEQAHLLVNALLLPSSRFMDVWNGDPAYAAEVFGVSNVAARHRATGLGLRINGGVGA